MDMFSISLPLAQIAGGDSTMSMILNVGSIVAVIAIFYFLLIRPQSKKQKETEKMLSALKKGDKVVTIGGIHAVVSSVKETTVILKLDDNCKAEFSRSAVSTIINEDKTDSIVKAE